MKRIPEFFKRCFVVWMTGASVVCHAGEAEQALARDFPPQSIKTVEQADAALKLIPAARAEIDARAQREKADCYERFLTSSCLNESNSLDRQARKAVRRVEVEANALLRKERAAERDRAVAEREKRAAEQRAKAISITGSTRDGEPSEPADADDVRR